MYEFLLSKGIKGLRAINAEVFRTLYSNGFKPLTLSR